MCFSVMIVNKESLGFLDSWLDKRSNLNVSLWALGKCDGHLMRPNYSENQQIGLRYFSEKK